MSDQLYKSTGVKVESVGGIDSCELTFEPGLTLLVGENATNRSSLLRAVGAALGGSTARLKSDATEGSVELTLGDETYERRFEDRGGHTLTEGDPLCADGDLVDTFVTLTADNPARRAVERGTDLRDVLMRPVDTEAIEREIREKRSELDEVESRLTEIDRRRQDLPDLEAERQRLDTELGDIETELAEARADLEEYEADPEEAAAAEDLLEELEATQSDLRDLQNDREAEQEAVQALEAERRDLEESLSAIDVEAVRIEELETRIDELRAEERTLTDAIADLSAVVEFNDDVLDGDSSLSSSGESPAVGADGDVTAALVTDAAPVQCWTCGSEVDRAAIEERLDEFRDTLADRRRRRQEILDRIDDLQEERDDLEAARQERDTLEDRRAEIDRELDRRRERLDDVEDRIDDVRSRVEELETRIDETEDLRESDLLDLHGRVGDLEYERGQLESTLSGVEREIAEVEQLVDEREAVLARRRDLEADLEDLRSTVEDRERAVVEAFDEHMDALLERLAFANLERVWLERKVHGDDTEFDLHVVRSDTDGTVYEDTVATTSESERELVGLVVPLAGYEVHEVAETVPFLLLDSLEAVDADRIAELLAYVRDTATFELVALLPEDAAAATDEYDTVSSDEIGS
jgi:DNA repair ATPase RecN